MSAAVAVSLPFSVAFMTGEQLDAMSYAELITLERQQRAIVHAAEAKTIAARRTQRQTRASQRAYVDALAVERSEIGQLNRIRMRLSNPVMRNDGTVVNVSIPTD